jgi:hypothetical protein
MSEYNWCHGPSCHIYTTTDRVRGSKGSKVLRTRKIKTYNGNQGFYNWFCSQRCERDFCNKHTQQIIRIEPRHEPLETPINDPEKKTYQSHYGDYTYTRTTITKVDNESNVG